ncbi:hypothetical protein WAI453_003191 [Rhynchosporium graminicola]
MSFRSKEQTPSPAKPTTTPRISVARPIVAVAVVFAVVVVFVVVVVVVIGVIVAVVAVVAVVDNQEETGNASRKAFKFT